MPTAAAASEGVYLAGDGARILGADGAEAAGGWPRWRRWPISAMPQARRSTGTRRRHCVARCNGWTFRSGVVSAFPWPHPHAAALPDAAIVCRCEAVTAGELRRCVGELGSREVNRAKAFSRVGMGRCQGRFCGHSGAEIVAAAAACRSKRSAGCARRRRSSHS